MHVKLVVGIGLLLLVFTTSAEAYPKEQRANGGGTQMPPDAMQKPAKRSAEVTAKTEEPETDVDEELEPAINETAAARVLDEAKDDASRLKGGVDDPPADLAERAAEAKKSEATEEQEKEDKEEQPAEDEKQEESEVPNSKGTENGDNEEKRRRRQTSEDGRNPPPAVSERKRRGTSNEQQPEVVKSRSRRHTNSHKSHVSSAASHGVTTTEAP